MADKRRFATEFTLYGLSGKTAAFYFNGNPTTGIDARQARTMQDKIEWRHFGCLYTAVTGHDRAIPRPDDRAARCLHDTADDRVVDGGDVVAPDYTATVCANAAVGADIQGIALLAVAFAVFCIRDAAVGTGE